MQGISCSLLQCMCLDTLLYVRRYSTVHTYVRTRLSMYVEPSTDSTYTSLVLVRRTGVYQTILVNDNGKLTLNNLTLTGTDCTVRLF
jgi:hypothetical protein